MNKKTCIIAAILATMALLPFFGVVAYAATEDEPLDIEAAPVDPLFENPVDIEEAPPVPVIEYTIEVGRPFSPSGTGAVIDNATDGDGKEFYTIMTPDDNVFYLVIDRQRGQDNVYFLNAVTEADLLSLVKITEYPITPPIVQPPAPIAPEPTPAPEPEPGSGNTGTLIIVIVAVLIGGGAGWYFKIYRPKQQQAGSEEDYSSEEPGQYDDMGQEAWPDDDDVPWYNEGEGSEN